MLEAADAVMVVSSTGGELSHSASKASLLGRTASSLEAEATSSVGRAEVVADLEALSSVSDSEAWKATTTQQQPTAIWQRK